jgi:NAD(P)-dependent dehydrogenase (short-subunit alcohol dehydrogenase family)
MRERRSGLIVNISSIAGRLALSPQGAYAASKFAVEAISECLAQEMKAFGVRVAVIEPGVILTPIFRKGGPPPESTPYPQRRRLVSIFTAAMPNASSPFAVGDLIAEIAAGDSDQLRYRVGCLAEEILSWRESLSDEAFIALSAASDADYAATMKAALGIDVAP